MDRRHFLGLGAAATAVALVPGCSTDPRTRISPDSQQIADLEQQRRLAGATVHDVELRALVGDIDLGGSVANTWTYGGGIPGPPIRVRRGDVLKAAVRNDLPVDTAVHWHGIALRNDMDGVAGLTQSAIKPGESSTYEFVLPDAGTYWFHPHQGTQLDRGLYAPLIVEDPADGADYDSEAIVVLDDWLGTDPDAVLAGLRESGMGGMDHSKMGSSDGKMQMPQSDVLGGDAADVLSYKGLIANGRSAAAPRIIGARVGERIRLRIINAAADTAFRVGVPGQRMRVTHTDGFPVEAASGDSVLLGMGERIDAIITVSGVNRVLAIGEGRKQFAQIVIRPPNLIDDADVPGMAAALSATTPLKVGDFVAAESARLDSRSPDVTHDVVIAGPGEGTYKWTINGVGFDHANPFDGALEVEEGQRVRLRLRNETTMFHPMHLHGHTFGVAIGGKIGPRKDTALVLPDETIVAEFDATNPGQWLIHCHNVYHGEAGMMSVLSYVK